MAILVFGQSVRASKVCLKECFLTNLGLIFLNQGGKELSLITLNPILGPVMVEEAHLEAEMTAEFRFFGFVYIINVAHSRATRCVKEKFWLFLLKTAPQSPT